MDARDCSYLRCPNNLPPRFATEADVLGGIDVPQLVLAAQKALEFGLAKGTFPVPARNSVRTAVLALGDALRNL